MATRTMTAKRKAALARAKGHHHHHHNEETWSPRITARLVFLVVILVCSVKIIYQNVNISMTQKVVGATNNSLKLISIGNKQLNIDDPSQQYLRGSINWGASGAITPELLSGSGAVEARNTIPGKERVHGIDEMEKIDSKAPQIDVEGIVPHVMKIKVVKETISEAAPTVKDEAPDQAVKEQYTETEEEQTRSAPTILIVVTTTRWMLPVRVAAILKAWARNVPGNVMVHFFVGTDISNGKIGSKADIRALALEAGLEEESSLHVLRVADDEYPPVYKNTEMLNRADQIVTDFRELGNGQIDWIFKVDDDTYVNIKKLSAFLESRDPTQHHFYGSQGSGRPADRDGFKNAGLEKPYCMGGPGFILSHTALHATAPTFKECVKEYDKSPWREQIWHSDSIIGLCVQHQTGLGCWDGASEKDNRGRKAFRHVSVASNLDALILNQKRHVFSQSISIHPLKEPASMAALHILLSGSDVVTPTEELSRTDSLSLSRKYSLPSSETHQKLSFATDAADDDIIPLVLLLAAKNYPTKFKDRVKRIRNWHAIGADKVVKKMIKKSIQEIKDMSLQGG